VSRSSDRAAVEPVAALVALLAVGVGLATYAVVLADARPDHERDLAEPTLERVHEAVVVAGVADPDRLDAARRRAPDGYRVAVVLETGDREWRSGARPPPTADAAARRVSVRVNDGDVRPGRLRVTVWR